MKTRGFEIEDGGWLAPGPTKSARGLAQSKTWRSFSAPLLFLATAITAGAQPFSIDWHTLDGGGGVSAGGAYTISGAIGQPDAGMTMTGGAYSFTGGFWSLLRVVQTPGAPSLSIALDSAGTVVVSWSSPSVGWRLQHNTSFDPANWATPAATITDNGTTKFIVVTPAAGNRFYRLSKP